MAHIFSRVDIDGVWQYCARSVDQERAEDGGVPEWLKGADCKSAGLRLRWFESNPLHQTRGCSSKVELQPSKLAMRVRFPPPAPVWEPAQAITALDTEARALFLRVLSGLVRYPVFSKSNRLPYRLAVQGCSSIG